MVCVLVEQGMEWFHLDLRHLGGNLLVNRLVHELRWVHLLVCNNIAVNLTFLRSPANKTYWQGGGGHPWCILWKNVSQCFYIFPDPESSHALFWRIPCTYGGQARCPLLPNWCNLHCAKHANTYTTKYNLPYHYLHRLQEKSMKKRIFWQLHLTMYHNAVSHQWQGEESFEGATSVCAALF